jgi:hypothetical protein
MPPTVMHIAAVGQELEISFDHAGDPVGFIDPQSEARRRNASLINAK